MPKNKEVTAAQMNAIRKIITEQMGLKLGHPICSTASLEHSLKIDGLDMDEIVMSMEEEFEIEIPNHVLKKWNTVSDIEQYIANKAPKDYGSSFRVQQPKKIAVKKSKAVAEPVKFLNARPHNVSLILGDLEKKLKPTKATEGFTIKIEGTSTIACYGADPAQPFARAVVSVSEGFNGFRLYVGKMLVIEHNIGSESHILELCELARDCGASMPASLDDWMVAVIVRYVACVKRSLRYMQHLHNGKDTTQQLFSLQRAFELKITDRVFDLYESENVVTHAQADVLRVFNEMIASVHPCRRSCYNVCSSFREVSDLEDEEDKQGQFEGENIYADSEDDIVDLLADVSTPGLVALFNRMVDEGMRDLEDSNVYELTGIRRRIAIIQELGENLTVGALIEYAKTSDLKSCDAAIFAGR